MDKTRSRVCPCLCVASQTNCVILKESIRSENCFPKRFDEQHTWILSWIWLPLTTSLAPHYSCTSPMDCISHHALHSPQSLVLAPADISERYPSCCLLSLCLTPDCSTLEPWTCACDPDFCLVLFTSLPCLWFSCLCPLTFACLILSIKYLTAHGSRRLWPVITDIKVPNN